MPLPRPQQQAPSRKRKEGEEGIDITHVDTWGFYINLAFDGLADLTGHEWWRRTEEQIDAVAKPAARICREQLPAAAYDKMQKGQNVIALLVGVAFLILPPLLTEYRYWQAGSPDLTGRGDPGPGTGSGPIEPPRRSDPAPRAAFGSRTAPAPVGL